MDELISVIVPIYKTEKYLRKCVDSIISQTYQNLEIILVNDGSPDNSAEICDEYAKKDKRIKVLHQENGGISVAMNNGLDVASGAYIATVDSDDYIHEEMLEILYRNLKHYDADISVCGFTYVYENGKTDDDPQHELDKTNEIISIFNSKKALEDLVENQFCITVAAWNKLYKKELFESLRYKEGKMYEDLFIIHRILDKASKIVYSNLSLYYYLQRESSIMAQPFNFSRFDIVEAFEDRMNFLKEKGYDDLYPYAFKGYLGKLMEYYDLLKEFYPEEKEKLQDVKNKIIALYKKRGNIKFSVLSDIKYSAFYISPFLHNILMSVYNFKGGRLTKVIFRARESIVTEKIDLKKR